MLPRFGCLLESLVRLVSIFHDLLSILAPFGPSPDPILVDFVFILEHGLNVA